MISLFKIRYTYLKRHGCGLVLGYILLPATIIIIFLPISIIMGLMNINRRRYSSYGTFISEDNHISNSLYKSDKYSFEDFIANNLENAAILSNLKENGRKLSNFIKNETNIKLDYYTDENELIKNKYTNIIIYNQNDGRNEFQLKIIDKFNNYLFNFNGIYKYLKSKFNIKTNEIKEKFEFLIKKFTSSEKIDDFSNITILNAKLGSRRDRDYSSTLLGIYLSFEMTLLSYFFTVRMIDEKEKKLHDFLERQGISKKKYIMSWFVTYSILSILPFVSFLCVCGISFLDFFFIGLIDLILYMFSIYSVIYFFYITISSLKKGSIIIKIFNFVSSAAGYGLSITIGTNSNRMLKLLLFLIPQINIYNGANLLILAWDNGKYSELFTEQLKGITYIESVLFFIAEIIFYSCLALFIQSYKKSGLNFCLYLKSFFTYVSRNVDIIQQPLINGQDYEGSNILNYEIHYEELSLLNKQKKHENKCLKVVGVTKKFNDLKAVNNFNCEFFSNEIFCLLGHNGAGKTTLINMISGIMDPEEGDIFLNGISLVTNKELIYQNIGLCQQQDIFFDYLNVQEHLQYIYDIKGIPRNFNEIQELIIKLDLSNAQFSICNTLSGGQKRKLCIALALLSGGKITILDEPTSGMDIIAKKKLWEFLKSYQKDKIIIVTTHSLEEAEYLGNRIGIMSDGRLICYGTSPYLKTKYPCGININLIINSKVFNDNNKKIIYEKIKEYDPQAEIKVASKGVFSINIQENNEQIYNILNYVEECKNLYGIEDYIVGSASLEDVFLKINNKSNIKDMKYTKQNIEFGAIIPEFRLEPSGFWLQLGSQLYRNLLPIFRNKLLFTFELGGALTCSYIFIIFFRDLFIDSSYPEKENIIFFGISIVVGYIIYLGGFVFEKIKERKTKTKYLLYLSGCNMWSYWCAFLIIDFFKLLIFSILSMIPLFYFSNFSNLGFYIISCLPMMCLSSLLFMYFFSLFWRDEDSGTKILLSIILVLTLLMAFLYAFILMPLSNGSEFFQEIFFNFLEKRFLFTLFDTTPLTSLGITIYRVVYSYLVHLKDDREIVKSYYKPIWYVISGNLMQMVNFIVYFYLLVLHETGALSRCFMKMHSNESDFVFSEESVDEDFYAYNNLRNPLIYFQNANNNQNSSNNNNQNDNNINNIDTSNNINSINDSRSQTQSSIDIDTSSQNNINNINNTNNNNIIIQNPIPNEVNQINPMINNNNNNNINPFVQAEINKIRTNPNISTKIEGLYKTFFNCCTKNVRVVNNLYLGLEPNEKFGLLGFNGSGKTTTFRAITNELMYEKGSVTLFGYDGKTQFDKLRPMIGYCPQENPLFDYMKVREIIQFYLNLKKSNETVESVCATFNLSKYLDTYCVNLSGGNKRKLTFAIALMNKPSLLLLDEPSTGVDPESRRIMWKNINELSNTGHQYNMILTTHSIEEAEILCDRVSWLKKGNFVCIGNPEQLKLKYSNGYKLHIKFLDTVVNKEEVAKLTRQMVQDEYNAITSLVLDFNKYSNYIAGNPIITLYIRVLVRIARELKPNTYKLRLLQIEKDFSFMLEVGVLREKQKDLFAQIFNMKKRNPEIAEISINLESLGNILTYFR